MRESRPYVDNPFLDPRIREDDREGNQRVVRPPLAFVSCYAKGRRNNPVDNYFFKKQYVC
ncbi:MAG: hypothetical protein UY62_C0083G0006 [Parcubacteria group bacterium GW2011_GWF2_50_9]|nr:MAG: hypothetical protein UY62_C0083G0006 [Parcubacteria group bacterium GW2011_GWF2_50_9]